MVRLGDTRYETQQRREACLYRQLPSGALQALAVKARPGFRADRAIGGVLYRVEWIDVDSPDGALAAGAARFRAPDEPRAAGNCVHVTCAEGGTDGVAQWWCYRPREYDGGTLSLLHEWRDAPPRTRSRRLRVLTGER